MIFTAKYVLCSKKYHRGGQMGMLYYWPTPQPPGDSWHRTKHTLFQFINLHGTKHRPEAASSCCTPTNQDGNEGDKHEVVHVPAVQARHNCPHEGHCTAIQRIRNGKVINQTQIQRVAGECALENRHGANSSTSAMCETALFFWCTPTP